MKNKVIIPAVLLTAVLAAGGLYFAHIQALEKASAATPAAPPPVPIVAGTVAQHDVPIYLTGVGTVIAYTTDIVRAQIQGQHQLHRRPDGTDRYRPQGQRTGPRRT